MVGVPFRGLRKVDIFDLLGLDPYELRLHRKENPIGHLRTLRKAWRRSILLLHPDKHSDHEKSKFRQKTQHLVDLRDYLSEFDHNKLKPIRIKELILDGRRSWRSTWNPWLKPDNPEFWKPIHSYSQRSKKASRSSVPTTSPITSQPGSSYENPIVVDAAMLNDTNGESRKRQATKSRRRRRRPKRSTYHPLQASRWRPAPYTGESDTDNVMEPDW